MNNKLTYIKHKSIQLAGSMALVSSEAINAEKMLNCATRLRYAIEQGTAKLFLNYANFCNQRSCPICQWRCSFKVRQRLFPAIRLVLSDNPELQALFLTLTIKNCHQGDLRWTIRNILIPGWRSFSRRVEFPAVGYFKSLEVTRPKDCYYAGQYIGRLGSKRINQISSLACFDSSRFKQFYSEEVHPHFHVLLLVNGDYLINHYLEHKDWVKLWRKSARLDYTPVVDIRRVYSTDADDKLDKAVFEVSKYALKVSDMTDSLAPFILRQLHGIKLINVGGILRKYFKDEEIDKIIATGKTGRESHQEGIPLNLDWSDTNEEYQITKLADIEWELA